MKTPRGPLQVIVTIAAIVADVTVMFQALRNLMGATGSCGASGALFRCSTGLGLILIVGGAALLALVIVLWAGICELRRRQNRALAAECDTRNERLITAFEYKLLLAQLDTLAAVRTDIAPRTRHPLRVTSPTMETGFTGFASSAMSTVSRLLVLAVVAAAAGMVIGLNLFDAIAGTHG